MNHPVHMYMYARAHLYIHKVRHNSYNRKGNYCLCKNKQKIWYKFFRTELFSRKL